jgi:hypothetical protein
MDLERGGRQKTHLVEYLKETQRSLELIQFPVGKL